MPLGEQFTYIEDKPLWQTLLATLIKAKIAP
jgi:hypothetical protein